MKSSLIERFISRGTLVMHHADGSQQSYGQGQAPFAHVHLRHDKVLTRLLSDPEMAFGEAYMDGDWWPGEGGLEAVFELYFANTDNFTTNRWMDWLRTMLRGVLEMNNRIRSEKNVQHHYDIDNELFEQFLDDDMQYSCAYFAREDMSLKEAQRAKLAHIGKKLRLQPGDKVLDIGCGWGGMALFLAENHDVEVVGLTLSNDQYEHACKRAQDKGLTERVSFLKEDYREHQGAYDAIVSVGMFEHVGRPQYQTYFDTVARLLKANGRSLIHTIARNGVPPKDTRTWIQRYIFPGGYIPSLSEISPCVENSGLQLSDLEVWRQHYAKTLAAWNQRFQARRDLFKQRLGERFCRMWEFYLLSCEAVFRYGDLVVFHLQLAHGNDQVPTTRDYLYKPSAVES